MLCTWFLGNISALALSEVQATRGLPRSRSLDTLDNDVVRERGQYVIGDRANRCHGNIKGSMCTPGHRGEAIPKIPKINPTYGCMWPTTRKPPSAALVGSLMFAVLHLLSFAPHMSHIFPSQWHVCVRQSTSFSSPLAENITGELPQDWTAKWSWCCTARAPPNQLNFTLKPPWTAQTRKNSVSLGNLSTQNGACCQRRSKPAFDI